MSLDSIKTHRVMAMPRPSIDWPTVAIGAAVVGVVVAACMGFSRDKRQWQEFSVAHHCEVVGRMPGEIGYLCDNGTTYWRDH